MRKRYCAVCGERLGEGAERCPNCGATAVKRERRKLSPRSRRLALFGAGLAAAVILAALAGAFLPDLLRSDSEKFIYYQQKLLAEPALRALDAWAGAYREGAGMDLTVTARTENPDLDRYLRDSRVTLKLRTGDGFVANLDADFMGGEIFASALTYRDGTLGLWLPQARDVYYTAEAGRLLAFFTGAEIGQEDLTGLDAGKIAGIFAKYVKIALSLINDGNVTAEKGARVDYAALDGDFTGTVYTFRPSAEDVAGVTAELAGALEDDGELAELVAALASAAGRPLGRMRSKAALRQLAAVLRANADRSGRSVSQAGFAWSLAMEGREVRRILVTAGDAALGLELWGSGKDSAFAVYLREGEDLRFVLSGHSRREDGRLRGDISLRAGDLSADIGFDCREKGLSPLGWRQGDYTISTQGIPGAAQAELEVSRRPDGSFDHTVSIPGAAPFLEAPFAVTVNASPGGTAAWPSAPPEDISGYSDGELQELFRDLGGSLLEDLRFAVGDIGW